MFKKSKTSTCCGHKKKNLNPLEIKMVKTPDDDSYTFEDLPCDVRHLLHELGPNKNLNVEMLLIKINKHIRSTDSFRKKDYDPTKFEADLKLFKKWFNQRDEQAKDKYQFYYGKDCHQQVDNYMNFNEQ